MTPSGFFMNQTFISSPYSEEIPHQGVGVEKWGRSWTRRYHYYYQWIPLFLSCYIGLFYFPRFVWKIWEGKRMKGLCDGFDRNVSFFLFHKFHIAYSTVSFCRVALWFLVLPILIFVYLRNKSKLLITKLVQLLKSLFGVL